MTEAGLVWPARERAAGSGPPAHRRGPPAYLNKRPVVKGQACSTGSGWDSAGAGPAAEDNEKMRTREAIENLPLRCGQDNRLKISRVFRWPSLVYAAATVARGSGHPRRKTPKPLLRRNATGRVPPARRPPPPEPPPPRLAELARPAPRKPPLGPERSRPLGPKKMLGESDRG